MPLQEAYRRFTGALQELYTTGALQKLFRSFTEALEEAYSRPAGAWVVLGIVLVVLGMRLEVLGEGEGEGTRTTTRKPEAAEGQEDVLVLRYSLLLQGTRGVDLDFPTV